MKYDRLADQAAEMYNQGMSVDAVASELGIAYRTARKAIWAKGVEFRDPSARLVGRTRPDKKEETR
jgi:orotate phosphoribosyltransferase-like protein